jgi:hypothetical protein
MTPDSIYCLELPLFRDDEKGEGETKRVRGEKDRETGRERAQIYRETDRDKERGG